MNKISFAANFKPVFGSFLWPSTSSYITMYTSKQSTHTQWLEAMTYLCVSSAYWCGELTSQNRWTFLAGKSIKKWTKFGQKKIAIKRKVLLITKGFFTLFWTHPLVIRPAFDKPNWRHCRPLSIFKMTSSKSCFDQIDIVRKTGLKRGYYCYGHSPKTNLLTQGD